MLVRVRGRMMIYPAAGGGNPIGEERETHLEVPHRNVVPMHLGSIVGMHFDTAMTNNSLPGTQDLVFAVLKKQRIAIDSRSEAETPFTAQISPYKIDPLAGVPEDALPDRLL